MKKMLFSVGLVFLLALVSGAVSAVSCGDTISGNTVLTNDLIDCVGNGLNIGANNITLDCNNHVIAGDGGFLDYGIYINNKQHITIKNCNIQGFGSGIKAEYSDDNSFSNNKIRYNRAGISLKESEYNFIYENIITDNKLRGGIYLTSYSQYNAFWGNYLINNIGGNANESVDSNYNDWNKTTIGNYWSDFISNPGYPNYYEIHGLGDGIDYRPIQSFDADGDGIYDPWDNCVNVYNAWQGDIDNDGIGDACDYQDTRIDFFYHYVDTQGNSYDQFMGGGPCNNDGCSMTFVHNNTVAYCPGENYCAFYGNCYPGDGTGVENIDRGEPIPGIITGGSYAICVGHGWWDCDSGGGTNISNTPLPGMEVCGLCQQAIESSGREGFIGDCAGDECWTLGQLDSGEYPFSYNGYGCCGDDFSPWGGEYYYNGYCSEVEKAGMSSKGKQKLTSKI